jgi:hypothetical protein
MEKMMLNTLSFNLTLPTPYNFLARFLKAAHVHLDKPVSGHALFPQTATETVSDGLCWAWKAVRPEACDVLLCFVASWLSAVRPMHSRTTGLTSIFERQPAHTTMVTAQAHTTNIDLSPD